MNKFQMSLVKNRKSSYGFFEKPKFEDESNLSSSSSESTSKDFKQRPSRDN